MEGNPYFNTLHDGRFIYTLCISLSIFDQQIVVVVDDDDDDDGEGDGDGDDDDDDDDDVLGYVFAFSGGVWRHREWGVYA